MGLSDQAKAIDIFGYTIGFNVKGSDKIKTFSGAVLSILFTGCCIALVVNSFISSLDKSNPVISQATFDKKPDDRIYINSQTPMAPVLIVRETSLNPDSITTTTVNMTEPLRRLHFELRWIKTFVNEAGIEEELVLGTGVQIMCSDLKVKPGAFYYPNKIEMSVKQREAVEKLGVCFEVPENYWYAQMNDSVNIGLDVAVYHCHQRDDCFTNEKGALDYTVGGFFPRVSPNIYSYENPVAYKYSIGSELSVTKGQSLSLFFNQLFEVENEHVLLDTKKSAAKYQSFASEIDKDKYNTLDASLTNPKLMKCGTDNWKAYDFASLGCVVRTGFYCDKELKSMNKLCSRFAGIFLGFDSAGQLAQKTVFVRKYAKVLDILGSLGGLLSLVHQIFGFLNILTIAFLNSDRVISMFFPIFKMKKLLKPDASKKLKQKAVEFIDDSLDVCNIIRDITCLRLLIDVLLDEPQKQLALVSSLQRFTAEADESKPVSEKAVQPMPDKEKGKPSDSKSADPEKTAAPSESKLLEQQIQSQVVALQQIRERSKRRDHSSDAQEQLKKRFDAVICGNMASIIFEAEAQSDQAKADHRIAPTRNGGIRSPSQISNRSQPGSAKGPNTISKGKEFGNEEENPLQDFELGEHKSLNQVQIKKPSE